MLVDNAPRNGNVNRPKPTRSNFAVALTLCLAAVVALGGCSKFEMDKFDMSKNIPWGAGKDGNMKPPMKVVAVWTDTVLSEGMRPATRGFGGRLMFYDSEGGKPIKVKGTLMVYAFDETGRDVEQTKPDRKYVFTPEQFEKHYSKSSLGDSYSVWLPWDGAGGPLREVSLLVRFQPEKGAVVIGDASKQHLPGTAVTDPTKYPEPMLVTPPPSNSAAAMMPTMDTATTGTGRHDGVQLAGYETQVLDATNSNGAAALSAMPRRMSTTTISLPTSTDALRRTGFAQPTQPGFNSQATASSAAGPAAGQTGAPFANSGPHPSAAGSAPSAPPATRFEPGRRRPLGAPLSRLERGHAPWQHSPEAPPSAPPGSR